MPASLRCGSGAVLYGGAVGIRWVASYHGCDVIEIALPMFVGALGLVSLLCEVCGGIKISPLFFVGAAGFS